MNDPIAMLKADHREVSAMLKELAASEKPSASRRKTTAKVVAALLLLALATSAMAANAPLEGGMGMGGGASSAGVGNY